MKRNAVMSIPYLIVFGPTGNRLLALTASFKRMPAIKTGLHTIVDNPQVCRTGALQPCVHTSLPLACCCTLCYRLSAHALKAAALAAAATAAMQATRFGMNAEGVIEVLG